MILIDFRIDDDLMRYLQETSLADTGVIAVINSMVASSREVCVYTGESGEGLFDLFRARLYSATVEKTLNTLLEFHAARKNAPRPNLRVRNYYVKEKRGKFSERFTFVLYRQENQDSPLLLDHVHDKTQQVYN